MKCLRRRLYEPCFSANFLLVCLFNVQWWGPSYVASLAVTAKKSSFLSLPSFGMAGMHRHVRLNFIIVMSGILLFNEYMLNIKLNIMDAKHVHIKNIIYIYIY